MPAATGDFTVPIPGGFAGVLIVTILAAASVLTALVRRRTRDPAEPAVNASVEAATGSLAESLVRALNRIRELEDVLDEAYQAGFKPRPRPRPDHWQVHRDD